MWLDTVAGVRPVGYRGPMWELTFDTPALLAKHGFRYDSGLMDADHPYRLAVGPEQGAAFYEAARLYYQKAPWRSLAYEAALQLGRNA